MKIVSIVPLEGGVFPDELSYFTAEALTPGMMLAVPVRQKKIKGLVVRVEEASAAKGRLRGADYALKKIEAGGVSCHLCRPEFIQAVARTADYYLGSLSSVFQSLIPRAIIDQALEMPAPENETAIPHQPGFVEKTKPETLILQQPDKERLSFYRSLVRENFARGQSVFICVPRLIQAAELAETLGRGINQYTYHYHSRLKPERLVTLWQKALREPHPILIIGTPLFLSLPRLDLKTIVIESERSDLYKWRRRPFLDGRRLAEYLAAASGASVIFADTVLRVETMYRFEKGELVAAAPVKHRLFSNIKGKVIAPSGKKEKKSESHQALAPELEAVIRTATELGEKMFIFAARRGASPIVICHDCERQVICRRCLMPVTLHQGKGGEHPENFFLCHHCHESRNAAEYCGYCGGWHLVPLGIGIDRVANEIKILLPEAKVWQVDSDTTPTKKLKYKALENFSEAGGILLGTALAVPFLPNEIDHILAVGLDSLLALPDFRISEKVFGLLIKLRLLSKKNFLIQSRNPDWPLFTLALTGNLLEFYRQELRDRETFDYPPFRTLIKVSRTGRREEVLLEATRLENFFRDYSPDVFEAGNARRREEFTVHLLLRLKPTDWPSLELAEKLASLPSSYRVEVDPISLL